MCLWENRASASCSSCRTSARCKSIDKILLRSRFHWWVAARNSPCWWSGARRSVSRWSYRASRARCVTNWIVSWSPRAAGEPRGYARRYCNCQGFTPVWFSIGWWPGTFRMRSLQASENVTNAELFQGKCARAGSWNGMSDMWEFVSSSSHVKSIIGTKLAPLASHCSQCWETLALVETLGL